MKTPRRQPDGLRRQFRYHHVALIKHFRRVAPALLSLPSLSHRTVPLQGLSVSEGTLQAPEPYFMPCLVTPRPIPSCSPRSIRPFVLWPEPFCYGPSPSDAVSCLCPVCLCVPPNPSRPPTPSPPLSQVMSHDFGPSPWVSPSPPPYPPSPPLSQVMSRLAARGPGEVPISPTEISH